MSILGLLKPMPHVEEIKDVEEVKKKYRYWRLRIFYSMFIGYAAFYLTRNSFTFAAPILMQNLGFTKSDLGILSTILTLTYGASKFFSGIMSDKSNPRYFMGIGLILTGIFNIAFGFSSSLFLFALIWGFNGWFQGWGWAPCARLLTHWYSHSERGSWWSMWNISHNVGGFIIPLFAGYVAQEYGWRYAMFTPGVVAILIGFYLMNRLRDTPPSLGLPAIEKFRNDYSSKKLESIQNISVKEILVKYILKNKYVWLLCFANLLVYIVRLAFNTWSNIYLFNSKGYSCFLASSCVAWFEIGGILGSLAAGWSSDLIFKSKRGAVNALFMIFSIIPIWAFWSFAGTHYVLDCSLLFAVGFFIFGPQMLIGVAVAELSHPNAAGTSTGFSGWFGYVGGAIAGYPLGRFIDDHGWNNFFLLLCGCAFLAFLVLIPLWNKKTRDD